MGYDEGLAERIRAQLDDEPDVMEKRMFGVLAFLVGGYMTVAVSGQDGLMARVDREHEALLVERPGVEPMVVRGRRMTGWLLVEDRACEQDDDLAEWIARALAVVRDLPPKR